MRRHKDYTLNDKFNRGEAQRGALNLNQVPRQQSKTIKAITDKEGLDRATATADKLYVNGDTMYVAGTSNLRDVWDDFKIPFGKTAEAQRYKDADALLGKNSQVTNLVGHSLGGAAVLELQKNHTEREFKTNTYGAPLVSWTTPDRANNNRYRNYGDPISFFDRGAKASVRGEVLKDYGKAAAEFYTEGTVDAGALLHGALAAHSYKDFTKNKISENDYIQQQDSTDYVLDN